MTKIKEALISGENKGRRLAQVALAMIGVVVTHGGTLPGYTEAVMTDERVVIVPAYWDAGPTLVVIYLAVLGVGLTAWMNWKPDATVGLPK
jgi:hypothetical protein